MFRIEAAETPETAVKRIVGERLDTAVNLLTQPEDDFDKSVHTTRKSLKRIRAVLRLIRDEIGDETYRRENIRYRDAGRRLAPLRDSAVMVMTLDSIQAHYQMPDAFTATRAQLVNRQTSIRQAFLADANQINEVAAILQDGKQAFLALPFANDDFDAFSGGLQRIYRQGQRLMNQAYEAAEADPVLFHNWRKRVKYLWYHLEILEPLWPPIFQEWVRELHYISDLLGEAHDLEILHALLSAHPEIFTHQTELAGLLPLLHKRQRELEEEARPYGRRLFSEKPKSFVNHLHTLWIVWQTTGIGGLPPKLFTLQDGDLLSVSDAAKLLGTSPQQVRRQIHEGIIPAVKVSRTWVIPGTAVLTREN